jgi:putative endonuclease
MTGPYPDYTRARPPPRLYVGVTNDVARRLVERRSGDRTTFTGRYNITRPVHIEPFTTAIEAIAREKQIKAWSRDKKVVLVETSNPQWRDLSADAAFARMLR